MTRRHIPLALIGLIVSLLAGPTALKADEAVYGVLKDPRSRSFSPPDTTTIYNGIETGDYPSAAQLMLGYSADDNFGSCSATLIGCDTVLTAAHCVCPQMLDCGNPESLYPPEVLWVFLQHAGTFAVSEVHVHPEATIPGADVAVLKLAEPVTGVAPTPINDVTPLGVGALGTIVGYGHSDSRFSSPGVKRFGQIETIDCGILNDLDPGYNFSNDELLCWSYEAPVKPGEDSNNCYGDSGGPLFTTVPSADGPRRVVAGITSGGFGCVPPTYSFDVNVYQYRDFIRTAAGGSLESEACGDLPPVGSARTVATTLGGEVRMEHPSETKVFPIPPDTRLVRFTMNGDDGFGSKYLAFYAKRGNAPTAEDNDCAWTGYSTFGLCEIQSPAPGNWYVRVDAAGLSTGGVIDQASFQVTATAFDVPETAGRAKVTVEPRQSAISPGGVLYYTFTVANLTQEPLDYALTYRIISPGGKEQIYGPAPMKLAAGAEYTKNGRMRVSGDNSLGTWTIVVEAASTAGVDRGWDTFEVQNDRAVDVKLSATERTATMGGTWPFTMELRNLTGRSQKTSMLIEVTEPSGKVVASDPLEIRLAPDKPWSRIYMVGHNFSEADIGEWKVVVATTTGTLVDRAEIRFVVVGVGKASIRIIEGAVNARAMTPDGKTIIGQALSSEYVGNYIWTEDGGVERIGGGWTAAGPVAISDDGSTVLGHATDPAVGLEWAAIWTRDSQTWEFLEPYDPNVDFSCGLSWTAAYDMSADGSRVVGLTYTTGCNPYAFQWTRETGMTLLPREADGWAARANVISADGSVIGGWDGHAESGSRRAAMWVADEPGNPGTSWSETLLGSLEPGNPVNGASEVQTMNASGTRLYGDSMLDDRGTSFVWTSETGVAPLAEAPARHYGIWPTGASEDGRIVVGAYGPLMSWARKAFIVTPERGWMPLSDYLVELGVDLAEAGLEYLGFPSAISSDGRTIVGYNWAEAQVWVVTLPD